MKNKFLYHYSIIKLKIVKQDFYFNEINEVKRQSEDKIDVPLNEVLNEEIPFSK